MLFDTDATGIALREGDARRRGSAADEDFIRDGLDELSAGIVAAGQRLTVDITDAVLTLDFDHCGGTDELPNTRLIVQRAEWKAGHHPKLVEIGLYNPLDFDIGHNAVLVEGVHDVFGDESVVCLPTPGHTPGHQSLRVQTDTGAVVLTADCVYFRWMLDDMVVPTEAHDERATGIDGVPRSSAPRGLFVVLRTRHGAVGDARSGELHAPPEG